MNLFSPPDDYGVNATDIELFYNVSDGALANCTLFLNGTPVTGNTTPLLYTALDGNNNFTLTGMEYGRYNSSIACWDQNNFSTSSLTWRFQLDTDVPLVTLNAPADNQTIFSASVTFNWTVIDTDPSPLCDLTLDGVVNQSNIISNETIPTLRVISGVTGGNHSWNVTCWDGTGFSSSETRNLDLDATVRVTLTSPANNSIDGDGTVSFSYTPESIAGFTLGFCDLYLNNVSNATHIGLISGSSDTFVIPAIPDGNHEWYVNCTDSANTVGVSETWRFVMDLQDPVVGARSPNGTAFTVAPSSSTGLRRITLTSS